MKYPCLILDHDDTAVKSTPDIHYPSFVEALKILKPNMKPMTLEEFVSQCFHPGFMELCRDVLKLTKEEQDYQYKLWKEYASSRIPEFYPGFSSFVEEYKSKGGIICVVSHSEKDQIIRDYRHNTSILPDMVFGWELLEHQRKPNPYPLIEVMKRFNLKNNELLVLDDLKPGLDMARSCNVKFASAGWSHVIPEIKEFMEINSDYYFSTVEAFKTFIF